MQLVVSSTEQSRTYKTLGNLQEKNRNHLGKWVKGMTGNTHKRTPKQRYSNSLAIRKMQIKTKITDDFYLLAWPGKCGRDLRIQELSCTAGGNLD